MGSKAARIRQLEADRDSLMQNVQGLIDALDSERRTVARLKAELRIKQRPWWQRAADNITARAQDTLDRIGLGL